MSYSFRLFSWFILGVVLSILAVPAFATVYPVDMPGVTQTAAGTYYDEGKGAGPRILWPQSSIPGSVSPKGIPKIPVPTAAAVNWSRAAATAISIVRNPVPVAVAVNVAVAICSTTDICQLPDYSWETKHPADTGLEYLYRTNSNPDSYETQAESCADYAAEYSKTYEVIAPNTCKMFNTNGSVWAQLPIQYTARCAAGYHWDNTTHTCKVNTSTPPTPTSSTDWDAAIPKLASASAVAPTIVPFIQDSGKPLPIDNPTTDPVTVQQPAESTVNRDATGTPTSTTTTQTTTQVSPITNNTTNSPTTVNVTNTITTTTTNNAGDVTSSVTTTKEPPPPEEIELEFDTVPEEVLEEEEKPLELGSTASWGESSCPGNPSVNVMGTNIDIPVNVVCDYMDMARPAVIALFTLIAMYIVVGAKTE